MEKNDSKIMRGAMMTGCGMWAPILPAVGESKTSEGPQATVSDSLLSGTPTPITISSGSAAKILKKSLIGN